jgi:hypothetical protein
MHRHPEASVAPATVIGADDRSAAMTTCPFMPQ